MVSARPEAITPSLIQRKSAQASTPDIFSIIIWPTGIWETEFCGMETQNRIRRQEAENSLKSLPQTDRYDANAL